MKDLVASIIADGKVDFEEVVSLREAIYADGKVSEEEADAIFEINDAVSGNDNCPEWTELVIEVISDFVLNDEETPGVISEEEGAYLVKKIQGDGQVDDVERALLIHLDEEADSIESQDLIDLIASLEA